MTDERDETITRIAQSLRELPQVDDTVRARLLIAVAAERERDREQAERRLASRGTRRWLTALAGVAAATVIIVAAARRPAGSVLPTSRAVASNTPASMAPGANTRLAATGGSAESASQQVQLVLKDPTAGKVHVVGDFNGWDKEDAPMVRDAETGLWSVTLTLRPGRHVYAFVVDDSVWKRDPRAAAAPDADFGRPGSVLLVGRPAG